MIKLSILIPTYNWSVDLLLEKLTNEILSENYTDCVEIILVDDGSSLDYIKHNNELIIKNLNKNFIRYYHLKKNVGRAAAREVLIQKATGINMLFLDADILPDSNKFITNYLTIINNNLYENNIILGGLSYSTRIKNESEFDFYYYMGKEIGEISLETRSKNPWKYVVTSNLLISASVIEQIPIDIEFVGYGFEDTEWGIRLMKKFPILHIDNTVSHLGLEKKENLVKKILESSNNYNRLVDKHSEFLLTWSLRTFVDKLAFLNSKILALGLKLTILCFKYSKSNKISLLLFQIIKVFTYAKQQKTIKLK